MNVVSSTPKKVSCHSSLFRLYGRLKTWEQSARRLKTEGDLWLCPLWLCGSGDLSPVLRLQSPYSLLLAGT